MMKHMKKTFMISALMLLCAGFSAVAGCRCDGDWKEKMMSEKVAFLTVEMDITPEEAQVFWPVYNKVNGERDAAMHEVFSAFKALEDALEAGKPEKEISELLDKYLKAQEKQREIDRKVTQQYKAVLPVEKVAKLYVGEEKFRRQHIRKLHGKPGEKK